MTTDDFDWEHYINNAGMGPRLPVQAKDLLHSLSSRILRSLLVAAPGDIPEEFGCSPEEAAVALACCELAEMPAWDEASLIDAATVGGSEEERVMWGYESRDKVARRISLAIKAEKAPEVMSPADGVLLLRRAGIDVFHQLLDAVAVITIQPCTPESQCLYRQLKNIAEPQQTALGKSLTTESVEQRRARYLVIFEIEEKREKRGALQRVADSVGVDRANLQKDITKARTARGELRRAGTWTQQLVQGGKRTG